MEPDELRAFHAGDAATFARLVDALSPRLYPVARALAGDGDGAAELLQETWVRAYAARRSFDGAGSLFGWLCAICRNAGINHRRRARRRPTVPLDPAAPAAEPIAPHDPAGDAARAELRTALDAALGALTERQRAVVTARLVEGRSTRGTARELGVAEGTVKATLHQALHLLRPLLRSWT